MSDDKHIHTGNPLIIYCYRQFSDTALFRDLLTARFRQTGHDRPVEFRFWDCYKQQPGQDGDLYILTVWCSQRWQPMGTSGACPTSLIQAVSSNGC